VGRDDDTVILNLIQNRVATRSRWNRPERGSVECFSSNGALRRRRTDPESSSGRQFWLGSRLVAIAQRGPHPYPLFP